MFEYEDGKLIVDGLYYDPSYRNGMVVKIKNAYYMISNRDMDMEKPIKESALRPYKKKIGEEQRRNSGHDYVFRGMVPRGGFNIEMKRPITADEFDELCKRYNLTEDDISREFDDKKGSLFGEKYVKYFKSIQISVDTNEAIPLETYLLKKGIEAGNVSPGRVNIRTDWGGYRDGAGRKPTGRKLARIYVTEEEEKKLRDYLEKIRNGANA